MLLSHPEYIKLVFGTYQRLRSTPEFSPALKEPTPKSVSNECLIVYIERPDKKDEAVLRSFFGPPAENKSFLKTIEKFPTDKFRAFANYLNGKAVKTDDKNVELLAWLIDFPHRPFRRDMNVILNEAERAILNNDPGANLIQGPDDLGGPLGNEIEANPTSTAEVKVPTVPVDQNGDKAENKKGWSWVRIPTGKKKWVVVGIALLFTILSIGAYQFYDNEGNCMYWNVDHYERIDCDAEINDKVLFNKERWKNFRKITDFPISEKLIGVAFYSGNKNREFFTCWGKHPVDPTRYLKVMTPYIWEKEFGRKDSIAKDTSVVENKKTVVN